MSGDVKGLRTGEMVALIERKRSIKDAAPINHPRKKAVLLKSKSIVTF
jgi:hypothetical protein